MDLRIIGKFADHEIIYNNGIYELANKLVRESFLEYAKKAKPGYRKY